MNSRDQGEFVSEATGSRDSRVADTFNIQPSGVVRLPDVADAIGAAGAPGTRGAGAGAALATGCTGGSAGGSAIAVGALTTVASRHAPSRAAVRLSMVVLGASRS